MDTLCGFEIYCGKANKMQKLYYFRKFFCFIFPEKQSFGTINAFKITNVILDNTKIEFCMYFSQYIKINVF